MSNPSFDAVTFELWGALLHGACLVGISREVALSPQEFADVIVVRGGVTAEGTYLFLCTARLMWKLDSTELAATLQQEIDNEVRQQGGDEALWRAMTEALGIRLGLIAPFQAGGTVSNVRLRLRMEQGGTDWIITELTLRESNRNPLSVLDPVQ